MTDKKPILSNETIIPAAEAETFPELKELVNLHEKVVDLPEFFTRHNRECIFMCNTSMLDSCFILRLAHVLCLYLFLADWLDGLTQKDPKMPVPNALLLQYPAKTLEQNYYHLGQNHSKRHSTMAAQMLKDMK